MRKLILAIAAAAACGAAGTSATGPVALAVPGRANANASVAAYARFVAVVWAASDRAGATDIELAVSRDAGATFSSPLRVNRTAGVARVSGEQPPRVVLERGQAADPEIVVVWTAAGAAGTRLVSAKSSDAGRSFTAEAQVPGSDAPGNRGWEAVAVPPSGGARSGGVGVIWVDHRELASSSGDMSHHMDHASTASMQADSVARAQLSKLYFASLGGRTPGRPIAAGVCYCCKTALEIAADGSIYAAWRHVYPGNIRDIAFTMSKDGGRTFAPPVRVSQDKWAIDGCPENGPALAIDARKTIHIAWPTFIPGANGSGTLGLFYASSHDGRTFTARQAVPVVGTPRHVQLAVADDGSLALAWDESDAEGRRVAFARGRFENAGRIEFARQPLDALGPAQYPAVAPVPGGVLVAAQSGGHQSSSVRVVRVEGR